MSGRTLLALQRLPDRGGTLNRDVLDADIREAMLLVQKRLEDRAQKYQVAGWVIKEPEWDIPEGLAYGCRKAEVGTT